MGVGAATGTASSGTGVASPGVGVSSGAPASAPSATASAPSAAAASAPAASASVPGGISHIYATKTPDSDETIDSVAVGPQSVVTSASNTGWTAPTQQPKAAFVQPSVVAPASVTLSSVAAPPKAFARDRHQEGKLRDVLAALDRWTVHKPKLAPKPAAPVPQPIPVAQQVEPPQAPAPGRADQPVAAAASASTSPAAAYDPLGSMSAGNDDQGVAAASAGGPSGPSSTPDAPPASASEGNDQPADGAIDVALAPASTPAQSGASGQREADGIIGWIGSLPSDVALIAFSGLAIGIGMAGGALSNIARPSRPMPPPRQRIET